MWTKRKEGKIETERDREWGEGSTVNTFTNWPRDSHKQSCRVGRQRKRERKSREWCLHYYGYVINLLPIDRPNICLHKYANCWYIVLFTSISINSLTTCVSSLFAGKYHIDFAFVDVSRGSLYV